MRYVKKKEQIPDRPGREWLPVERRPSRRRGHGPRNIGHDGQKQRCMQASKCTRYANGPVKGQLELQAPRLLESAPVYF